MSILKTNSIQTVAGKPLLNSTGSIIQVVQTVKRDVWSSASDGVSFYPVSGLTATITPTSSSNNILVILDANISSGYWEIQGRISRNGSALTAALGDARGLRTRCTFSVNEYPGSSIGYAMYRATPTFLDSPATTSPVTYGLDLNGYSTYSIGVNFNVSQDTNSTDYYGQPISTITLMEVVA